jgi:hypothetical protein
MVGKLLNAE